MATSVYFNNYNSIAEQRVVEDLIVESIKIMGFDAYYLPIFNEDDRDILYGEELIVPNCIRTSASVPANVMCPFAELSVLLIELTPALS